MDYTSGEQNDEGHSRTEGRKKSSQGAEPVMFGFMSVVSGVVFFTEEHLDVVDYLLILGAPFATGALAYFVGFHHDPEASD